jgi:hypothetical protein
MVSSVIGPSWQETLVALHAAETLEELWTVLLVPHGIRSASSWDEPYSLFRRFHADDPNHAAVTALLLCSNHRWRKAAHRLIHELADSGMLSDPALDQLAAWYVERDVDVLAPRRLFAGWSVVFTSSDTGDAACAVALGSPWDRGRRAVDIVRVRRSVWPPFRRWAATRHIGVAVQVGVTSSSSPKTCRAAMRRWSSLASWTPPRRSTKRSGPW